MSVDGRAGVRSFPQYKLSGSTLMPLPTIASVLLSAYSPCPGFNSTCASMRWAPSEGHVPRGFCGALGPPDEVRLILVVAEPGDPHANEVHPASPPLAVLESAHDYAYRCFRDGKDLFHRNIRKILDLCLPGKTFDEQMQVSWITESVLCSASAEGAPVSNCAAKECGKCYLGPQLNAFRNAVVVALGKKAASRLSGRSEVICAFAAAPPGCNFAGAEESWQAAAAKVRASVG